MATGGTTGTQGVDSMVEAVKKLASQIAAMKFLPDADLQFIGALEEACVGYVQQQSQAQAQAAAQAATQAASGGTNGPGMGGLAGAGGLGGGAGGPSPLGAMGGGGMDMGGGMPAQSIAPGGGSGMSGYGSPNPDELRRILSNPNGG